MKSFCNNKNNLNSMRRIRRFFDSLYNFWYFRKEIWNFRGWDYSYQLRLWRRSLVPLRDCLINGYEVRIPRMAKVEAIEEAIDLIDDILADNYIDTAEGILGINFLKAPLAEADKVVELANELAQKDWQRLWRIFEGQNYNEYIMLLDRNQDPKRDLWNEWFDGTDMRGWWD